jgi:hypothetical protein
MPTPLLLVVAALATYRLTRLVTADKITEPLRLWVLDRSQWAGYLVTCDWCLSIWIAPPVAVCAVLWGDSTVVAIGLCALAFSAVTGVLSLIEAKLDQ